MVKKAKIGVLGLVPMIYVMVAAGGFGCEDMVGAVGPGMTLIIFMVLPFVWSMPFGLVTAELASAYPVDGGMYAWAQEILGEKAGFVSGWCYMVAGCVEPALFAALSVNYLKGFLPFELEGWSYWLACLLVVIVLSAVNLLGIKFLSEMSTGATLLMLIPFAILLVLSLTHLEYNPVMPLKPDDMPLWKAAGQGLLIGIWLNTGFEAVSTMGGEIENGEKLVPKAIMIAIPFISIMYLVTIFPTLAAVGNWQDWSSEGPISFAGAGLILGGKPLNVAFIIAAGVSSLSICCAYIGAYSRIISTMSEKGQFFKCFAKTHPKYGTPHMAIIAIAVVSVIACSGSFIELVGVAGILYSVPIILMFVAAIKLRVTQPDLKVAYKVPLKKKGFIAFAIVPMAIYAYSIFADNWILGLGLAATSIPAYAFFKFKYHGGRDWCPELEEK
ncbi:MAG: APC family permease [Anaerovoracaceae bacterium]